ncbi:hypothetical protein ACVW1C_000104 [Bradyrhizobium sp. USDA 4011]
MVGLSGGKPSRCPRSPIHDGRRKKLRAALRYDLEQKGVDEWLVELAEEDRDAEELVAQARRPRDAKWPAWSETYLRAWRALQYDRQYGAMGGQSPISFLSIDTYARRYKVSGMEFELFLAFVTALDEEYLEHVQRKADQEKEAEEERKRIREGGHAYGGSSAVVTPGQF